MNILNSIKIYQQLRNIKLVKKGGNPNE